MSSEETHFLNVDLELSTRGEIAPLLEHWSKNAVLLRNSVDGAQRTAWLELGIENPEVDRVLRSFSVAHSGDARLCVASDKDIVQ